MKESPKKTEWDKNNSEKITIRFMHKGDADILFALEGKQKATEVKRLIRLGIEAEKKGAD